MDCACDSRSREPDLQEQSPEFKPGTNSNNNNKKKEEHLKLLERHLTYSMKVRGMEKKNKIHG
jgi:hypothetical protein